MSQSHTDATTKQSLIDAGANRADALLSTTNQDATNVMVCLLAAESDMSGVVSVVHTLEHMAMFDRIGVNTMENPHRLIAEYLYRAVKRPTIVDYMPVGERAEVFEIDVGSDAPITDKTLQQAGDSGLLGDDVLIVASDREGEGEPVTPRGNTPIGVGDRLTVYSGTGATPEITDVFGHCEARTAVNSSTTTEMMSKSTTNV